MADPAIEASSKSLMETIETPTEKVIIDDRHPQCSSDTIEAPDATVSAEPASQSLETNEVFDDAVGPADPVPQSSAIAEIPDAATETIRDEAIAVHQIELRYLDFLRVAVIKVATLVLAVYCFFKKCAFLFRPIIDRVEARVSPLCKSHYGMPFAILRFADQEIEILTGKLSRRLPSSVKRAGSRVKSELRVVRCIGLIAYVTNLAKNLHAEHETTVKSTWWWAIDRIPLFCRSVRLLLHIVVFFSEKYNQTVRFIVAAAAEIPLADVDLLNSFLERVRIDRAD